MSQEALYLKVASHICDKIIKKEIITSSIISEIDYVFETGVNKHIVAKAFEILIEKGILKQNEGKYVLSTNAFELAVTYRKDKVLNQELNNTFEKLQILNISITEFEAAYKQYLNK